MNEVAVALSYVMYVLHSFWRQGTDRPIQVGTLLEVSRSERNNLVAGQVARDATDAEIAEFRGLPPPGDEDPLDAAEALAALDAAKAQLATLEDAAKGLETKVEELQKANAELTAGSTELRTEVANLTTAKEALEKSLAAAKKAAAKGTA
jgi:phage shock protein A